MDASGLGTITISDIACDLDGYPRCVDIPEITDTGVGPGDIVDMGVCEAQLEIYLQIVLWLTTGSQNSHVIDLRRLEAYNELIHNQNIYYAHNDCLIGACEGELMLGVAEEDIHEENHRT